MWSCIASTLPSCSSKYDLDTSSPSPHQIIGISLCTRVDSFSWLRILSDTSVPVIDGLECNCSIRCSVVTNNHRDLRRRRSSFKDCSFPLPGASLVSIMILCVRVHVHGHQIRCLSIVSLSCPPTPSTYRYRIACWNWWYRFLARFLI